jgi:hypothetical protein
MTYVPPKACDGSVLPRSTALLIAHPGHELRVHRWLELAQPVVFVLTKGDGRDGASRIESTRRVIDACGARVGPLFGRFADRELYAALLAGAHDVFLQLLDELADAFVALDVEYVAADAEEGYNPTHDVCRYLAEAATAMAVRTAGRPIGDFEFPLVARPDEWGADRHSGALRFDLDEAALDRKLACARAYPELREEVTQALARFGADAFRVERLMRAVPSDGPPAPVFYERVGADRVAAGQYGEAISYAGHVAPVRHALGRRAAERSIDPTQHAGQIGSHVIAARVR